MLLKLDKSATRTVDQVIALMVASFPAISHAQFYRALERDKTQALRQQKGDFEATMTYSSEARSDLNWLIKINVPAMCKPISLLSPDLTIQSDASLFNWAGGGTLQ